MKITIYRWEIVLLGSPSMALPSSRVLFSKGNVPDKGGAWAEALRHHGPLGSPHVSTWLAHGKRRTSGETRPWTVVSLPSLSLEGCSDPLVLTPPSQLYIMRLP